MFEQMYTDSGKLPVQAPVQQMLDGMHSVLKRNENIVQNSDNASYLVAKIIILIIWIFIDRLWTTIIFSFLAHDAFAWHSSSII